MIDSSTLRKLQLSELTILKEIKRVCQLHGIEYSLAGGTLLGALRHKGFIPWDDDIDIYMTLDNFIKFEEVASTSLKKKFFFQTPKTDSECKSYFCGRVRLEGTIFESNSLPNNWKHNGFFVDVLPVLKVPKSKIKQKIFFYFFQVLIRIIWLRNDYNPHPSHPLFYLIMKLTYYFSFLCPSKLIENILVNYHKKYESLKDFMYIDLLSSNFNSSIIEKNLFETLKEIQFEDDYFTVFDDSEVFLTKYYGDWKKLPPKEEQIPHHILKIDFGDYS